MVEDMILFTLEVRRMIKLKAKQQMSESMVLAVLLTLAGGFQDAYSYNCRGKVFANAQTGNIVLLGQNLAQGNWGTALHYLMPLAAFISGVYVTEWVHHLYKDYQRIHWRQIVLIVEVVLLAVVGILPHSFDVLANVLMSFACAGNMRSATEMLCKYHITKDITLRKKSMHYYFVILIFTVGAAAGAVMSRAIGLHSIWIAGALLAGGFVLMFVREE